MKQILLLFFALFILSCGSKKKTVNREKVKTEVETAIEKVETVVEEKKVDSVAVKKENTLIITEKKDIEFEANEGGVITREVEYTDTGYKETYTGVKNVSVRESSKEENKATQDSVSVVKSDSTNSIKTEKKNTTTKEEKDTREMDLDVKRGFPWWILILIVVIFVGYKLARKFRVF